MPRFYCPFPLAAGLSVELPPAVAHHLHVLRLQPGAPLTLFNGDGAEYAAVLEHSEKRRASAAIEAQLTRDVELPYAITLVQALPEASKMDWIIEKAVELGVAVIRPVAAQRCVVRLNGERAEKKQLHWQGVIEAASEQSGRNRLARLAPVEDFHSFIARHDAHQRILLSPRGGESLAAWARQQQPQALTLMIGPEGGYTHQEEDAALGNGAVALSLGPRVLRTETAGLAACSALVALWHGL